MTAKVTVLTTVYNGLPYLKEAVESVLSQTERDFEYLFVDDASTDESLDYLRSLSDSRVRILVNPKNLGTAGSMNRGIAEASTTIIMRLDQDDVSLPTRLEKQLLYLNQHPEVAIVSSWEHTIDSSGRVVRSWRAWVENRGAFMGPLLIGKCPIWHPSIMFRRKALEHIGGFVSGSWPAEDFDVTMRLALAGFGAGVVPAFLLLQRQHRRRQSIQSEGKQIAAMQQLHTAMVKRFCPDPMFSSTVAEFLRMEGRLGSKTHLLRVLQTLHETTNRLSVSLQFTEEERATFARCLRSRLGWGPTMGRAFWWLPAPAWRFGFYCASPLCVRPLRRYASTWYRVVSELRYPRQFFTRS